MLNREELIALVEDAYFSNVDNKNLEPAVACFAEDAELRIQSAHVSHVGHDQIRRMFRDFMGTTKIIHHGDFTHVVDAWSTNGSPRSSSPATTMTTAAMWRCATATSSRSKTATSSA